MRLAGVELALFRDNKVYHLTFHLLILPLTNTIKHRQDLLDSPTPLHFPSLQSSTSLVTLDFNGSASAGRSNTGTADTAHQPQLLALIERQTACQDLVIYLFLSHILLVY